MRKINRLACFALALGGITASAQESVIYTNELRDYNHAIALFNEEQYLAAQLLFEKIKNSQSALDKEVEGDCVYYIANCAIRLDQVGAEYKIDEFVKNYPTSAKRNKAYIEVTDYYFVKGQYEKAVHYAAKVKETANLSEKQQDRFNFQKGYSFFYTKNIKEAKKYLSKVGSNSEWSDQAIYYLGYIAYEANNYDDAKELFEKIDVTSSYQDKMGYYRSDMNFKTGNFEKALTEGLVQMDKVEDEAEKSELSKIVGESYFNLGQYDKAVPYLQTYEGKDGKWSNTDFYQLGYAYYKQKDYSKAIEQFNKIIGGDNAVAQNAYYHLGESYLRTHKKVQALNAFKNASEMHFDTEIQEDAFLNYAKLSYEIGNAFESAPKVLNAFLNKYPNSPYKAEIENLLIDSYISSKNYKEALVVLEKNRSSSNALAYQKVTFARGLELYSEGEYQTALDLFNKAIAGKQDLKINARALYWKAETLFSLGKYKESIQFFDDFKAAPEAKNTGEYKNLSYSIAYSYFKLKDYESAIKYFNAYVAGNPTDANKRNDAYLRLGDCNFVTGKYWPAMDAFNKVIDANHNDVEYARFQKAISYGFVDRTSKKIEDLTAFVKDYPQSNLADDAQYEIGVAYASIKDNNKALAAFEKLQKDYPSSSFVSRSILRQGLIYYNTNKPEEALSKFKQVVKESPNSQEALEAVQNARLVYVDNGKVDEYAAWVKGLSFVEVSDAELDSDTFESAEKQYMQGNNKSAIDGYEKYLKSFPNGQKSLQAHFYLAQMYFVDNNLKKALGHYEDVLKSGKSEYTEVSLARASEIYLKDNNKGKAIETLLRLETEAVQEQNKTFARSNLMKLYYEKDDYNKALSYAEKVIATSNIENRIKNDAQIIIAKTAMATGNEEKARKAYAEVLKNATGEVAAEAQYYDAYFKNKDKKYEQSNESVQKLAKNYSSFKYFGAKGLVLMAKNFYALKDSYQATYILESVVKNFSDYEDVIIEAKKELEIITTEEAKRNSSVAQ